MPSPERLVRQLAVGRILTGVAAWTAPGPLARLFGIDASNAGVLFTGRLFAAREAALGVATLATSGAEHRRLMRLGLAVDVLDCSAALVSRRDGASKTEASLLLGPGLLGVIVGLVGVTQSD